MTKALDAMLRRVIAGMRIFSEAVAMVMLLQLKAIGLTQVEAVCVECRHRFDVPIAALHLPDETLVGDVWALRPIASPQCSAPAIIVPPNLTPRGQREDKPQGISDER